MMINRIPETLVEMRVTYTIELNGQIFMIENVPARVNEETGEQLFAPSTVESIQRSVLNRRIVITDDSNATVNHSIL